MQPKRHSRTRIISASLLTVCGFLVMTGCANPIEQLVGKGAEVALEKAIEQGGGGAVDLDMSGDGGISFSTKDGGSVDFGSSASVPDDWPGLPLPNGELLTSYHTDGSFALSYRLTVAEAESLYATLTSSGFDETGSTDMSGMKMYVLEGSEWRVTLGWIIEDDTDEATVQYMVNQME